MLVDFIGEPTVIALESPAVIVSTLIVSFRFTVTPLPATATEILSPERNTKSSLPDTFTEPALDDESASLNVPPAFASTYALTAADEVLVPIQCEYLALEGLGQLINNVEKVKTHLNEKLHISMIALVMFDGRTKLASQVVQEVRDHFGHTVCNQVIPRSVRLSEAPSYGQPIIYFDPKSRAALAYRALAKEISSVT